MFPFNMADLFQGNSKNTNVEICWLKVIANGF